jgi:hypothetical protein
MCEMVQDDDSDSESEEECEMLLWFMGFDMFLNEVQKSMQSPKVSGRSKKGGDSVHRSGSTTVPVVTFPK